MARLSLGLLVLILPVGAAAISRAEGSGDAETEKIESLIRHVAGMETAVFIRNGREYDSHDAARLIRTKWKRHEREIKTAADFIEKAASYSTRTKKPYLVRFEDGHEMKTHDYLFARLKELDARHRAHPPNWDISTDRADASAMRGCPE